MTDDRTTETRTRRTFLTALAGVAGVGGVSMAREALTDEREQQTAAFRLSARTQGWRGGSPKAIAGQTNPTLELRAGGVYELAWKNASGDPQNFAFRDSSGDYLPVIRTTGARLTGQGTTETVTGTTGTVNCRVRRRIRNRFNGTTGRGEDFTSETVDGNFTDTTDGRFFNDTTDDGFFDETTGDRFLNDTTETVDDFFNDTTDGEFFDDTTGTADGFFNGTTGGRFFDGTTGTTVCPGGRQNRRRRRGDNFTDTTATTLDSRVARSGVVRAVGEVQTLRFVAVEEMAEYVSTTNPATMVGAVEVSK
ncbi:hypothetical protein [Halorussus halophilus]|uniref:hypothetical protein n=1 Tax=Halorussus halophilus TaxID=2650975 RepID=UPI00130125BE|nr:hypothetical protein [Halorussus halophilus]